MRKDMKGKKILNIFLLLLVLIPLSILLHTGFFKGCAVPLVPVYVLSYDRLSEGKYSLWGYKSGENVGEIFIIMKNDNFIEIKGVAEAQEGKNYTLDQEFRFNSLELDNIRLEMIKNSRNDSYFVNIDENLVFIIVNIANDGYYRPIPGEIYNTNRQYYLLSVISKDEYNFATNVDYQSFDKTVFNMAYRSYYTCFFYSELREI
jgi:hypothetical protein